MSVMWDSPQPFEPRPQQITSRTGRVDLVVYDAGHPLASTGGRIYLAKKVLWDSLGRPFSSNCIWCGWEIWWRPIPPRLLAQTDHLNGISTDNRPQNLAPSCYWCNTRRGGKASARFTADLAICCHLHPMVRTAFLKLHQAQQRYEAACQKLEAEL
jgi:hypothetical protein